MWLVPTFLKKPKSQALTTRLRISKPGHRDTEGNLTSYCAVVNHVIAEYTPGEIIAETVSKI